MNPSDEKWQRLTVAARRSTDDRDAAAPYGFATRVVAQAWTTERPAVSLVERFAWRALGVACLFAVLGVVVNYSAWKDNSGPVEDSFFKVDDPAAMLLDVS